MKRWVSTAVRGTEIILPHSLNVSTIAIQPVRFQPLIGSPKGERKKGRIVGVEHRDIDTVLRLSEVRAYVNR